MYELNEGISLIHIQFEKQNFKNTFPVFHHLHRLKRGNDIVFGYTTFL